MSPQDYHSYKDTIVNAILQCNNLVEEHRKAMQRLDFELDDLHEALDVLQKQYLGYSDINEK